MENTNLIDQEQAFEESKEKIFELDRKSVV